MARSNFLSLNQSVINAVFEKSMDAILITSPDGRILDANKAACIMFGRTRNEIIRLGRTGLVDATDKRLEILLKEREKTGKVKGELTFLRKGGTVFQGEASSEIFRDENGLSLTIMIIRDITERIHKEEKLHFTNEIISNIAEGIQLTRCSDFSIIYTNSQFEKMFGYNPGELIGQNVAILNAPSDIKSEDRALEIINALNKSASWKGEILNIKKNGEHFWSSVTITKFEHSFYGNVWISIHQDITDRRKIEKALIQSDNYNRSLIEVSLDPLVTIDKNGKILDVNLATQKATGFSRDELIGTDFSGYFTDPEKARRGYKKVFSSGFVRDFSLEIKNRNGQIIQVLYNATVYRDENDKIAGVFAAARDITQRKLIEDQLRKSSLELRKLTQHLEEIIEYERTQIAHNLHDDLGQKLTALNLDLSWLRPRIGVQSYDVEIKLKEMVSLINESIERVRKISYDLRPSILDDLGLQAAIEWQLSEFNKISGIQYEVSFSPEIIEAENNISLAVFRIIQESLTNITRHSRATRVTVSLSVKDKLQLVIRDNGVGIDTNKLSMANSFGLQGIAERAAALGGKSKFSGIKNRGTKIEVVLPIKKSKEIPVL
jgi:PAS domain S-box-containing protein